MKLSLLLCTSAALALSSSCSGYYRSYRYMPRTEVHEVSIKDAGVPRIEAQVKASVVGILRPRDVLYRRLHARLTVENTGSAEISLKPEQSRLVPGGMMDLDPEPSVGEIRVPPSERRTVDLYFPLPGPGELPNTALRELTLKWTLAASNTLHESQATFEIGRPQPVYGVYSAPVIYHPYVYRPHFWYYGRYYCY